MNKFYMNTSPLSIGSALLRDTQPASSGVFRPGPPVIPQESAERRPRLPKRSLHILCIDDDESILAMMKDCLSHYGHQVRVASGGKHGIELFRTALLKSEPCEVVITDLGMPDMDGFQVARMIKTESPDTPIVMMTGEGKDTRPDGAEASSVSVVVGKPPRIGELNDLLLRMTTPTE
jgi:CheY-like chemotaxis protein